VPSPPDDLILTLRRASVSLAIASLVLATAFVSSRHGAVQRAANSLDRLLLLTDAWTPEFVRSQWQQHWPATDSTHTHYVDLSLLSPQRLQPIDRQSRFAQIPIPSSPVIALSTVEGSYFYPQVGDTWDKFETTAAAQFSITTLDDIKQLWKNVHSSHTLFIPTSKPPRVAPVLSNTGSTLTLGGPSRCIPESALPAYSFLEFKELARESHRGTPSVYEHRSRLRTPVSIQPFSAILPVRSSEAVLLLDDRASNVYAVRAELLTGRMYGPLALPLPQVAANTASWNWIRLLEPSTIVILSHTQPRAGFNAPSAVGRLAFHLIDTPEVNFESQSLESTGAALETGRIAINAHAPMAYLPDLELLAYSPTQTQLYYIDFNDDTITPHAIPSQITALQSLPSHDLFVAGYRSGDVVLRDSGGAIVHSLPVPAEAKARVQAIVCSIDGRYIAASFDVQNIDAVCLWRVDDQGLVGSVEVWQSGPLAFSCDSRYLYATSRSNRHLLRFDVEGFSDGESEQFLLDGIPVDLSHISSSDGIDTVGVVFRHRFVPVQAEGVLFVPPEARRFSDEIDIDRDPFDASAPFRRLVATQPAGWSSSSTSLLVQPDYERGVMPRLLDPLVSAAGLPIGMRAKPSTFEDAFPDLSREATDLEQLELPRLKSHLRRRALRIDEPISVFGVQIPRGFLLTFGPVLIVALQLFFVLHFRRLRLSPPTRYTDASWRVAWAGLYALDGDRLALVVFMASAFLAPSAVVIWSLCRAVRSLLQGNGTFSEFAVLVITVVATCISVSAFTFGLHCLIRAKAHCAGSNA